MFKERLGVTETTDTANSGTKSLTAQVQAAIEEMIAAGELKGGDRVNEIALSERFGTSRGPLREACRALAQVGLLVAIPNRGVFVRELDLREALDVYDIRASLHELIGSLVAERIRDDEILELQTMVTTMDSFAEDGDLERYYPANLEFHERLLELAGNDRLTRMYNNLIKELHLFRRKGLIQLNSMRISNEEHRQVVDAIANRDPIAAGAALRNHAMTSKQRLLAAVRAEAATAVAPAEPQRKRA